jgi:hypothetical protein
MSTAPPITASMGSVAAAVRAMTLPVSLRSSRRSTPPLLFAQKFRDAYCLASSMELTPNNSTQFLPILIYGDWTLKEKG